MFNLPCLFFQTELHLQKEKDAKAKVEKDKRKVEGDLKVCDGCIFWRLQFTNDQG